MHQVYVLLFKSAAKIKQNNDSMQVF